MSFTIWANNLYLKLMKSDDTPHRIALGFAIGIFYGLMPFVGVIFTILTVLILRANKASALIGCFVTNTWMSVVLLLPSVKLGAKLFGLNWQSVWRDTLAYTQMASISDAYNSLSRDVIIPSAVGFFIIAFFIAILGYFISIFLVLEYRNRKHEEA